MALSEAIFVLLEVSALHKGTEAEGVSTAFAGQPQELMESGE